MAKKVILTALIGATSSAFLMYLIVTYALEKGISVRRMMSLAAICGGFGSGVSALIVKEKKQSFDEAILAKIRALPPGSKEAIELIKAFTPTDSL